MLMKDHMLGHMLTCSKMLEQHQARRSPRAGLYEPAVAVICCLAQGTVPKKLALTYRPSYNSSPLCLLVLDVDEVHD